MSPPWSCFVMSSVFVDSALPGRNELESFRWASLNFAGRLPAMVANTIASQAPKTIHFACLPEGKAKKRAIYPGYERNLRQGSCLQPFDMTPRSVLLPAMFLVALLAAAPSHAADPGRWTEVRRSPIPIFYYQGVAADPAKNFFFDGINVGLYRTDAALNETGKSDNVVPADVSTREGYNHIGDIAYDLREGGRVLLPMECYVPRGPNGGNTCGTGSIGVANPETLAWRYYVKLDPQDIKKAM